MESWLFFLVVGFGVYIWYGANQSKSRAVVFARRECERHGVQFLDQTVERVRTSASRDTEGKWRLWREYRFDYSEDGIDRFEGRLILLGPRLIHSALETASPVIH